jgi:hypothetical protein
MVQIETIEKVAKEIQIDSDRLIKESLKEYLGNQLRKIEIEMFKLKAKYNVTSAEEIDDHYKKGTLEEEGTWEDFFRLDRLEYQKKQTLKALEELK